MLGMFGCNSQLCSPAGVFLPRLLLPEKSRSIFLHTRDVDPQGLAGSGMFPSAPGVAGKMILKTLESMGTLHGYGIARGIEQTSGDQLIVQYGTLYPALLRLEQEGYIASEWSVSDNPSSRPLLQAHACGTQTSRKRIRTLGEGDRNPGAVCFSR